MGRRATKLNKTGTLLFNFRMGYVMKKGSIVLYASRAAKDLSSLWRFFLKGRVPYVKLLHHPTLSISDSGGEEYESS
jgi:hypothetical protein